MDYIFIAQINIFKLHIYSYTFVVILYFVTKDI